MLKFNLKQIFLLTGILLFTVWCNANNISASDGYGSVPVKEATVQGCPKGSSIQASINGHLLTVVYSCYIQWHEFESDNPGLYFKIHAAHVTYANVTWLIHPHHDD